MSSIKSAIALLGASAVIAAPTKCSVAVNNKYDDYAQRAIEHYNIVTGNGSYQSEYFSPENVPYHSIETMMVEAPDHGHESVSETYSFWVWLEAVHGKLTGNYDGVSTAWSYLEKHLIPDSKNQPGNSRYNASSPATYAPEDDDIENYPAQLVFQDGIVGQDPIAKELQQAYGTWDIYAMHWIIDGDNWYGYGQQGDGKSKPSFINTFQRGASESAWKTVPHPCWETMKWGGPNGFLDLFTGDKSYAKQWRYTAAPDADARAFKLPTLVIFGLKKMELIFLLLLQRLLSLVITYVTHITINTLRRLVTVLIINVVLLVAVRTLLTTLSHGTLPGVEVFKVTGHGELVLPTPTVVTKIH